MKRKKEDDFMYFMKQTYRQIWWAIPLAFVVGIGLWAFLKPIIGDVPALVFAALLCGLVEARLIMKLG